MSYLGALSHVAIWVSAGLTVGAVVAPEHVPVDMLWRSLGCMLTTFVAQAVSEGILNAWRRR